MALVSLASSAHAEALFVPHAPKSQTVPPAGYTLSAKDAVARALALSKISRLARPSTPLEPHAYLIGDRLWIVRIVRDHREVAQVELDGRSGHIIWTAAERELDWPPIAHGERNANAKRLRWILLLSGLLFLVPFVDPRRLARLVLLDLAAVLSLGVSWLLAQHGHVYASTPLMYPPLLYLLGRFLWLALRGGRAEGRLTWMSPRALLVALAVLLVARYAFTLIDGVVNDVGYASLFGADSIRNGFPLYDTAAGSGHLDAYGPLAYLVYVPFELVFPFHDLSHNAVAAAQAAAIAFDLGTVAVLYAVGRRLRAGDEGRLLGACLAWGFAACPWTLLILARGTNDGLVALLLALVLLALSSPVWRGVLIGAAAATKFAPLALAPLFGRGERERGLRPVLLYGAAVVGSLVLLIALYLPDDGVRGFYDSTIGFQLSRSSPFSIWGLHPGWEPLRPVVTIAATLLAASAFFVPRDRSLPALAAMGAAVVLAVQLSAIHWYWFYVPWFMPYALVAFFSRSYAGSVRNSGSSSAKAVAMNSS